MLVTSSCLCVTEVCFMAAYAISFKSVYHHLLHASCIVCKAAVPPKLSKHFLDVLEAFKGSKYNRIGLFKGRPIESEVAKRIQRAPK